ncbi:hypothetical protein K8R66_01660 [bacterium]|nr:hypothetical protein [bacterium]
METKKEEKQCFLCRKKTLEWVMIRNQKMLNEISILIKTKIYNHIILCEDCDKKLFGK